MPVYKYVSISILTILFAMVLLLVSCRQQPEISNSELEVISPEESISETDFDRHEDLALPLPTIIHLNLPEPSQEYGPEKTIVPLVSN